MIAKAKGKYFRVSSRKVRDVINLIRGKSVNDSLVILSQVNRGSTTMISKVLKSAVNNAEQKGLSNEQLYISTIKADEGPSWRRFRAAPFGRATPIDKKTTHLTIELDLITK